MAAWGLDPLFSLHVRVFCAHVHRMRESLRAPGVFFLGEHPVQRACILGVIIGAMRRPRNVTYIGMKDTLPAVARINLSLLLASTEIAT